MAHSKTHGKTKAGTRPKSATKRAPKDKKTGLQKRYLAGVKGTKRAELARIIKQIAALYKAGKKVPQSLIKRRMALGKSVQDKRKK